MDPPPTAPLPGWGLELPYSLACGASACDKRAQPPKSRQTLDVVLAASGALALAPLVRSLLGALPLSRLEPPVIWAYFKGEVPSDALGELARVTAGVATLQLGLGLRNVGRAEHTCVHHVAANYGRLADVTLFLKDTSFAHAHLGVAARLLAFARRLPPAMDAWCARPPVLVNLSFRLDNYTSEACWRFGRCYDSEAWKRATVRPFSAWLRHHGVPPSLRGDEVQACYGGVFAASRRALQATARATYEAIERDLEQADSLEEGHYMERAWPSVWALAQPLRPAFARLAVYAAVCGGGGGGGGGGTGGGKGLPPSEAAWEALPRDGAAHFRAAWPQVAREYLPAMTCANASRCAAAVDDDAALAAANAAVAAAIVAHHDAVAQWNATHALWLALPPPRSASRGGAALGAALAAAQQNATAARRAISEAEAARDARAARGADAAAARALAFVLFSDQPSVLAQAARRGWRAVALPAARCRPARLRAAPHLLRELRPFDYTAYVAQPPPPELTMGALLRAIPSRLLHGVEALVLVRRGGRRTHELRQPEAAFASRHDGAALCGRRTANRTGASCLFAPPVAAVVRRMSERAAAFGERWAALSAENPHVREPLTLGAALRAAGRAARAEELEAPPTPPPPPFRARPPPPPPPRHLRLKKRAAPKGPRRSSPPPPPPRGVLASVFG